MSMEMNKAPVEQAVGDERAAFEQWLEQHMSHHFSPELDLAKYEDSGEYRYNPAADYWKAWQARAALAQPSPKCVKCGGTGEADSGGVHPWGEPVLIPCDCETEQAEAERPEVVASVVHSNPVVLGQCGPLNANDELMTVAQHAASVARWAEMFNRVEQQRDAALVEVERLRESKGDPVGSLEKCMKVMYERDEHAKRLEAALARVAELEKKLAMALDAASKGDAARQAAGGMEMEIEELRAELAELRARVAVVPDGYALVPVEPTREMFIAINKENDKAYAGGCHHGAQFEWLWAAAIEAAPRPNGLTVSESALDTLRKAASGEVKHLNNGLCPDDIDGHEARDPDCPVCRALLDTESNNV